MTEEEIKQQLGPVVAPWRQASLYHRGEVQRVHTVQTLSFPLGEARDRHSSQYTCRPCRSWNHWHYTDGDGRNRCWDPWCTCQSSYGL